MKKRLVPFLTVLISAASSASAHAQVPTPTAFPQQDPPTQEAPADAPQAAGDGVVPESSAAIPSQGGFATGPMSALRPRPGFHAAAGGGLLPTFGIGTSYALRDRTADGEKIAVTMPIWAGIQMRPLEGTFSPFTAVGSEFEIVATGVGGRSATNIIPEMRAGVSWGQPGSDFVTRMFPWLNVYALGGVRIPNDRVDGSYRMGLGISSPALMAITMASNCTPAPTTFEFVTDVDARTKIRTQSIRWSFQF